MKGPPPAARDEERQKFESNLRATGFTDEAIEKITAADDARKQDGGDDDVTLWPEHHQAWGLFLALRTQWRLGVMGGWLGLDYAAAECVMRMHKIKDMRRALAQLQVMEFAALKVLNAADDKPGADRKGRA